MQCQFCSQYLADGSTYCPYCGQAQTPAAGAVPAGAPAGAPAQAPYPAQPGAPYGGAPAAQQNWQGKPFNPHYTPPAAAAQTPAAAAPQAGGYVYGQAGTPASPGIRSAAIGPEAPLTYVNYLVLMLLSGIPIAGFVLLIIWSVRKDVNVNKQNWARAMLTFMCIALLLCVIFYATLLASLY